MNPILGTLYDADMEFEICTRRDNLSSMSAALSALAMSLAKIDGNGQDLFRVQLISDLCRDSTCCKIRLAQ